MKTGQHPSIDAIRVQLGNTGSKSTISRLMKEIEDDDGGGTASVQATVSEQLHVLVANLAARLELESEERFIVLKEGYAAETKHLAETRDKAVVESQASLRLAESRQIEAAEAKTARQRAEDELDALRIEHAQTTGQFATQVTALQEHLEAAKAHAGELGRQHEHAHQALEHFRTASKEQRDRESRQHEQQIQYLQREVATAVDVGTAKQVELREALQERADAIALLTAARAEKRQLEEQVRDLKPLAERVASQAQVIEELRAHSALALQQGEAARARAAEIEQRNLELERQLAAVTAGAQTQDQVLKEILSRLSKPERKKPAKTSAASS